MATQNTPAHLRNTVSIDASTLPILIQRAQGQYNEAAEMVVDSPDMAQEVAALLTNIARTKKEVETARANVCGPVHKAWKNAIEWFKPAELLIEQADSAARKALTRWNNEQDRLAREARAKAEKEAREERQRLDGIEARRQADAREAQEKADKLARDAKTAAESGDTAKAEELQQQAETQAAVAETAQAEAHGAAEEAASVTVQPLAGYSTPMRGTGIAQRWSYAARVEDLHALVEAVFEGKAPIECLQANESFLSAQARAFKKAGPLPGYPGVTVVATSGLSVRA